MNSVDIFGMVLNLFDNPEFFSNVFCIFFGAKMIYAHFFVANTIKAHVFVAKMISALFFVAKTIYAQFFVAETIYALFCRENNLCVFSVAKRCTHFVRKVFVG